MTVFGLTGGTGAGKTTALRVLENLGAEVIDADALYHSLTRDDRALRIELEDTFGPLYEEGVLDRKKLGRLVFQNPEAKAKLETITHAYIKAEITRLVAVAKENGKTLLAIDAIGLIESGLTALCDVTVAVVASEEVRMGRIMMREGIDDTYARLRIRAQPDEAYFRTHCDVVLENTGEDSMEDFMARAKELFLSLSGNAKEA